MFNSPGVFFFYSKENDINKPNSDWKPSQRPGKTYSTFGIFSIMFSGSITLHDLII